MIPLTPQEIQDKSFAIIDELLAGQSLIPENAKVIKRVIHATGDPTWANELVIHPEAISAACKALRAGATIITDVQMVKVGINRHRVKALGGKLACRIRHQQVARYAQKHKITRSAASMRLQSRNWDNCVLAIGNAPSALQEVCDIIKRNNISPSVIVGVPVGFVGSAESKASLRELSVPYITNCDRRGGSAVAVSIVNALLELAST